MTGSDSAGRYALRTGPFTRSIRTSERYTTSDTKSSRLVWLALKLRRSTLTIQTFIFEAPEKRHRLRNITLAIVTRLITERPLDDHLAGCGDQRLQNSLLSKSDLAADLNMTLVHRDGLTDCF